MTPTEARKNLYDGLEYLEQNPHQSKQYFTLLEKRIDEFFGTVTAEEVLSEEYLRESTEIVRRVGKIGEGMK